MCVVSQTSHSKTDGMGKSFMGKRFRAEAMILEGAKQQAAVRKSDVGIMMIEGSRALRASDYRASWHNGEQVYLVQVPEEVTRQYHVMDIARDLNKAEIPHILLWDYRHPDAESYLDTVIFFTEADAVLGMAIFVS